MSKDKISKTNKQFNSDITYCTCYECDIECERHLKHIPKGQKEAVFADFCGVCKPYLRSVVEEVIKNEGTK